MILDVSAATSDAMLDAVAARLGGAHLELLSSEGQLLVRLPVSDPGTAVDGVLEIRFADARALMSGEAKFGRVVAANSTEEVIALDVGDESSDATLKLNQTEITRGGPVRLESFKLVLP